jgi:hypothetical protein
VDSLEHRRLNLFSSEFPTSNDVLIEFQQDDQKPQMDFTIVAPTKVVNKSVGMRFYCFKTMLSFFNANNFFGIKWPIL